MHRPLAELTTVGPVERGTDGYRLGLALFEPGGGAPHRRRRLPVHCNRHRQGLLAYGTPPGLAAVLGAGLRRRGPRTIVVPRLLQLDLVRAHTRAHGYAVNWEAAEAGASCVVVPSTGRGSARTPTRRRRRRRRLLRRRRRAGAAAGPRRARGVRGGAGAEP